MSLVWLLVMITAFVAVVALYHRPVEEAVQAIFQVITTPLAWAIQQGVRLKANLAAFRQRHSKNLHFRSFLGGLLATVICAISCAVNYYLLRLAFESLFPTEGTQGFELLGISFDPTVLLPLLMILMEIALGFFILELLGVSHFFDWDDQWPKWVRLTGAVFFSGVALALAITEAKFSMERTRAVEEEKRFMDFTGQDAFSPIIGGTGVTLPPQPPRVAPPANPMLIAARPEDAVSTAQGLAGGPSASEATTKPLPPEAVSRIQWIGVFSFIVPVVVTAMSVGVYHVYTGISLFPVTLLLWTVSVIMFVGRIGLFIVAKGCDLLLAVLRMIPKIHL